LRFTSSATTKLHKFILFAPDAQDAPRSNVQKQHRQEIRPFIDSGVVKVAAPMITPESFESEDQKTFGSIIIYEGETLETVRKMVESDIYYTSGVWDRDQLVLAPILPVTSLP